MTDQNFKGEIDKVLKIQIHYALLITAGAVLVVAAFHFLMRPWYAEIGGSPETGATYFWVTVFLVAGGTALQWFEVARRFRESKIAAEEAH